MELMKSLVIFFVVVLVLPIVYSEEVYVPETFKTENVQVTSYFYVNNNLVASKSNNELKYYHDDRIGNNRMGTSSSGGKTGEFKSLPFGEEILNSNNDRFTLTGKELDSELYYFGARYYDAKTGRFTSVDPVKKNHDYIYVKNDPLNLVDLEGKEEYHFTWLTPAQNDPEHAGSPVHHYMAYTRVRDPVSGDWSDSLILVPFRSEVNPEITIITSGYPIFTNSMSIDMGGLQYRLAVSGVDSLGREGPKSLESEVAGEPPEYAVSGPSVDLSDTNSVKNMIYWYLEHPEAIQQKEKIEPKIYPNPSNDGRLTIDIGTYSNNPSGKYRLMLYDLRGRLVHDSTVSFNDRLGEIVLPDNLASGSYLLKIMEITNNNNAIRPIREPLKLMIVR